MLGNQLITELKNELAAVNHSILYVPFQTVLSLYDDHQRLRSPAETQLTNLSQINNPQKALGLSVMLVLCIDIGISRQSLFKA